MGRSQVMYNRTHGRPGGRGGPGRPGGRVGRGGPGRSGRPGRGSGPGGTGQGHSDVQLSSQSEGSLAFESEGRVPDHNVDDRLIELDYHSAISSFQVPMHEDEDRLLIFGQIDLPSLGKALNSLSAEERLRIPAHLCLPSQIEEPQRQAGNQRVILEEIVGQDDDFDTRHKDFAATDSNTGTTTVVANSTAETIEKEDEDLDAWLDTVIT